MASPSASEEPAARGISRLALTLILLLGFWLGWFAALVPSGAVGALNWVIAATSAVLLTLWYRRRARRYLRTRDAARRAQVGRVRPEENAPSDGAAGTT